MQHEEIRSIIGVIGNVVSFLLFIAPVPVFLKIWKRKDVEDFSPNPYLTTVLNCAMWVFYGMPFVHRHSLLVVTINGFGLFMQFVYIGLYLRFSNNKQRAYAIKIIACDLLILAVVAGVALGAFHTHKSRSMVTGIVCVVLNIAMYAMPADVMRLVIRTKSVEYLPGWLCLVGFINSGLWLTYALLRFDIYLLISNGSGLLLGAAQLILFSKYFDWANWWETTFVNKKTTEVQLSSTTTDGKARPSV